MQTPRSTFSCSRRGSRTTPRWGVYGRPIWSTRGAPSCSFRVTSFCAMSACRRSSMKPRPATPMNEPYTRRSAKRSLASTLRLKPCRLSPRAKRDRAKKPISCSRNKKRRAMRPIKIRSERWIRSLISSERAKRHNRNRFSSRPSSTTNRLGTLTLRLTNCRRKTPSKPRRCHKSLRTVTGTKRR